MSAVPSHKVIPGTPITVDGFRHVQPWVKAYFLSHAHSDHYAGITENWSAGPIYCSPVTAALAVQLTGVAPLYLHPLALNTPHTVEGVQVTLVDANHCPGAVQFLFELADGRRYVHCGDMRYCAGMKANPHLARLSGADAVFLDTTYCHPRHTFPPQDEAVEFVASRIHQLLQEDAAAEQAMASEQQQTGGVQQQQMGQQEGDAGCAQCAGRQWFRRLYLISTYVIGKERLLLAVAARTGHKLVVTQRKLEVLRRTGLSEQQLSDCFTTEPCESPIRVMSWGYLGDTWPYFRPNYTNMEAARQEAGADEVVGFVPTGWLYEMNKTAYPSRNKGPCTVHLVPYSEHSSYAELREYVAWLRPKQVIPTVGVSEPGAAADKARASMLQHFRGLLDETANKAAFLARMGTAQATAAPLGGSTAASAAVAAQPAADAAGVNPAAAAVGGGDDADVVVVMDDDLAAEAADGPDCQGAGEDGCEEAVQTAAMNREGSCTTAAQQAGPTTQTASAGLEAMPAAATAAAAAAASSAVAAAEAAVSQVELLCAVAGPGLTAAEAQQLLTAAAGDVNAAVNALLDKQAREQQQQRQQQQSQAGSNKRQQQGTTRRDSSSSKKLKKLPAPAASPGQASIKSFFGPTIKKQQQQEQQQSQQGLQEDTATDTAAAVAATADRPKLVLPALTRQPAAAAAAPGAGTGRTSSEQQQQQRKPSMEAAASPVHVHHDQQQRAITPSAHTGVLPTPAAEAGTPLGSRPDSVMEEVGEGLDVAQEVGAATAQAITARKAAISAEAGAIPGPVSSSIGEQQQQQQSTQQQVGQEAVASAAAAASATAAGKAAWSALLPGTSPQLTKSRAKGSGRPASGTAAAVGAPGKEVADHVRTADEQLAAITAAAAPAHERPATAAAKANSSAPVLVGTSSTNTSSVVSKVVREAPLLPLARYHPLHHACWPPGEAAPYLALGLTLAAIDGTPSRLLIADGLTNMFRSLMLLAPDQVTAAAYLVCGKIAPEYAVGGDLNVGGSVVSSALGEVCGVSRAQLRDMYNTMGDLGDVAQACRRKQSHLVPPPPLTVCGVFSALHSLAAQSGPGAAGRRQATVAKLLRCCKDVETKYLVRTLVQNLRVGAGWRSVLGPLAKAALLHRRMMQEAGLLQPTVAAPPVQQLQHPGQCSSSQQPATSTAGAALENPAAIAAAASAFAASSALKVTKKQLEAAAAAAAAAYHTCPNLGIIVDVLLSEGPEALGSRVQLTCGVPVKPMLAKGCTSVADSFQQLAGTAAAAAAVGGLAPGKPGKKPARRAGQAARAADLQGTSALNSAARPGVVDGVDSGDEVSAEAADEEVAHEDEEQHIAEELDRNEVAAAAESAGHAASDQAMTQQQQRQSTGSSSGSGVLSVLAEFKYDGQRAQIHVDTDKQVYIFSRNCEDRTASFPDVVQAMLAAADPAQLPLVVDAELVAVDRANGNRVRAFQELATRPRPSAAAASGDHTGSAAAAAALAGAGPPPPAAAAAGTKRGKGSSAGPQRKQQKLSYSPAKQAASEDASEQLQTLAAADGGALQPQQAGGQQQIQQQAGGVDVCVFAFDALCVAGRDLMGLSLRQRRQALVGALRSITPGEVQMAEGVEVQLPLAAACGGTTAVAGHQAGEASAAAAATTGPVVAGPAAAGAAPAGRAGAGDPPASPPAGGTAHTGAGAVEGMSSAEDAATELFFSALAAGSEGLMMKLLDGPGSVYQPARRGLSWVKLKRDYLEGLADSLDLVPIGAWRGNGRKVKWFSPFLLAVYDAATETFQSLCRCMSGFTDEFYAAATERLGATAIPGPKPYYDTGERPDVWFEPTEVWEIRGADITVSPVHRAAAGLVDPVKGLGLRFPRFLRLRPDKKPEEASGPDTVQELYNKQNRRIRHD